MMNKRAKAADTVPIRQQRYNITEGEGLIPSKQRFSRETENTPDITIQRPSFNELMRTIQEFKFSPETKKQI